MKKTPNLIAAENHVNKKYNAVTETYWTDRKAKGEYSYHLQEMEDDFIAGAEWKEEQLTQPTNINLWSEANSIMFDLAVRNLESTKLEGDEYKKWLTTEMNKHFTLIRK